MDNKEVKDPLLSLKYMGYCRVFTPLNPTDFNDFLRLAKFHLCKKTHTLWKDPIWESYSDEELLIEYFSLIFSENKEYKTQFELEIGKTDVELEATFAWLDEQVEKNKENMDREETSLEDVVTFSPSEIGN